MAQNFLNSGVTGEDVWTFIRSLKKSMRWSGKLIFIDTFKKVIATLSPSQVFYFLNMSEISGYNYFFINGSGMYIKGQIQHVELSPLKFSLLTAPAGINILARAPLTSDIGSDSSLTDFLIDDEVSEDQEDDVFRPWE